MKNDFGTRFMTYRKQKGYTQEEVAEKLNVSSQAVSKWENNQSYPDVTLLPGIAALFNTTIDALFGTADDMTVQLLEDEEKHDLNQLVLRLIILSADGDRVKLNLPLSLIKASLDIGMKMPEFSNN